MNILITGIGGPTPLGIARGLQLGGLGKDVRLIGVDCSPFAPGLYNDSLFDATYLVPHSGSPDYWAELERIIEQEQVGYAFVVPELEVLAWSKRAVAAPLPCKSSIPPLELAEILYDKYQTFDLLRHTDLVPKSEQISATSPNDEALVQLGYPFWVRSISGAGAIGSLKVSSREELENWFLLNTKIEHYLASEFLPGRNYACKVLFHDSKLLLTACAERVSYLLANAAPSGISGMCARGRLVNNVDLMERAERALRTIFARLNRPPEGMFTVDFKEDAQGVPKITEINIRHVSFTYAFAEGGANFALETLRALQKKPTFRAKPQFEFPEDLHFIRGVDSKIFLIPETELKTGTVR